MLWFGLGFASLCNKKQIHLTGLRASQQLVKGTEATLCQPHSPSACETDTYTHNPFLQRCLNEVGGQSLKQSIHVLCNRTHGSYTSDRRAGWDDPQACLHGTAWFLSIHNECCTWTRVAAYKWCLPQHTATCRKYQNITPGARVSPVVRMLLALQHPQGPEHFEGLGESNSEG